MIPLLLLASLALPSEPPLVPVGTTVRTINSWYTVVGYIEEDGHLRQHYRVRHSFRDGSGNVIPGSEYTTHMEKHALEAYYLDPIYPRRAGDK